MPKRGGKRAGAGRKPYAAETRTEQVMVRLSRAQLAQLRAIADEEGQPVALVVYDHIARWLRRRKTR